jgi:hypothetical protein
MIRLSFSIERSFEFRDLHILANVIYLWSHHRTVVSDSSHTWL